MSKKKAAVPDIPPQLAVPIVDNHTHIYPDPVLPEGETPEQFVTEAGAWRFPVLEENLCSGMRKAGIRAAITSGCELPELEATLSLARRRSGTIYAALAIHPNEAALHAGVREIAPDGLAPDPKPWHEKFDLTAAVTQVADLAKDSAVVCIGETGLDYFRSSPAAREAQIESFRAHIALAKELGKPMQIHDRDAHTDVIDVLLRDGAPEQTVFHCFSGDAELAAMCAEHGWYASFAGPITYPANRELREAFLTLPPELILVETDAPYLTPVPFRGHPNVVWGAAYTARYQAWLRLDPAAVPLLSGSSVTAAQVQAAVASVSDDIVDAWCEQLNANTRSVYGI